MKLENTSKKLNTLKEAQAQVQQQFDKGEIGADQYRAFQRELAQTENSLRAAQSAFKIWTMNKKMYKKVHSNLTRLFQDY